MSMSELMKADAIAGDWGAGGDGGDEGAGGDEGEELITNNQSPVPSPQCPNLKSVSFLRCSNCSGLSRKEVLSSFILIYTSNIRFVTVQVTCETKGV